MNRKRNEWGNISPLCSFWRPCSSVTVLYEACDIGFSVLSVRFSRDGPRTEEHCGTGGSQGRCKCKGHRHNRFVSLRLSLWSSGRVWFSWVEMYRYRQRRGRSSGLWWDIAFLIHLKPAASHEDFYTTIVAPNALI